MVNATDDALRQDLYSRGIFVDDKCPKCGCHKGDHDWYVELGYIECKRCWHGVAMAQVNYTEKKTCFWDVYPKEYQELEAQINDLT